MRSAFVLVRKSLEEVLTDISCVELVHADEGRDGHAAEEPGGEWAENGELALVEVVDEDGVELWDRSASISSCQSAKRRG